MTDTKAKSAPAYQIIPVTRPDGVPTYFFQINGSTRHSSYDLEQLQEWAEGYTGSPVTVKEG